LIEVRAIPASPSIPSTAVKITPHNIASAGKARIGVGPHGISADRPASHALVGNPRQIGMADPGITGKMADASGCPHAVQTANISNGPTIQPAATVQPATGSAAVQPATPINISAGWASHAPCAGTAARSCPTTPAGAAAMTAAAAV